MQHIIIGNFGNHSLAAMQALIEKGLSGIHFVYVETGWAAASWAMRVAACADYARKQGIVVHVLSAQATFAEMVIDRKQFPSQKFQWCAGFLKGLAILTHLDDLDPACEAYIVSGKRRFDSRRYANLQEFEQQDDLYQGRTLWYPLWQTGDEELGALIKRTGFRFLPHQSRECSPCIHANLDELRSLDAHALQRLDKLEQQISQTMFQQPISQLAQSPAEGKANENLGLQQFDLGCGAPWGCGE
ncbi:MULTISPECIES: phosphoadenosine phosphosulfate reductase family protein [unclassified Legionella]|uniref:phosphoadenosine phosphosulfate reductase domain-containing protein n=1 Tax=unclassified Legionella TaxID=2622702 RepID=UPI001E3CCA1B|nr:phosphoadenosine phosphosulfate reductase family protein [Legionella sp. 31fI33]MCC5014143.1 phosphoadenosine phosphosulfate reductase family protein [Legionella sp. 31fI33]